MLSILFVWIAQELRKNADLDLRLGYCKKNTRVILILTFAFDIQIACVGYMHSYKSEDTSWEICVDI